MDRRIQYIFLALLLGLSNSYAIAADENGNDPSEIFEPKIERQQVDEALVDDEDFEIGLVFGTLGIEDFGAAELYGVRFNYFINEDFFLQISAGSAKAGLSSAEQLFPGNVVVSNDKDFQFYDLNLGWNILPGEAFWGENVAVNTSFYLVVGAGNTSFLDNKEFTLTYGAGYRALLNDWLAFSVDTRNHRFNSEYPVGEIKSTHNLEFSFSVSAFF
ncbi:MAG: outer membrane beta-barrel domain-containing protein [Gammaproteobacteria bacterium]|nr:outer membrane beta-barrel domain-containing protein [Gammaproteobacteria bacterium]